MPRNRSLRFLPLAAGALLLGCTPLFAVCDTPFGGFAIHQCGDLAYFRPTTTDGTPVPIVVGPGGVPTNVTAVFWQIGFGNGLVNSGTGITGTGMAGAGLFNGNDNGVFPVDIIDLNSVWSDPNLPAGAVCLWVNNWGNAGIDGCCDNVRSTALPASDDDVLNPYWDVYAYLAGGPDYRGLYSLDWHQDYPMAVLLTEETERFFALAAIANLNRENDGSGENGPCAGSAVPPGNNPAPCDFRDGYYLFRDVADGLANPMTGLPNVVPWQEIPQLRVDGGGPQDPNDVSSPVDLDLSWPAAVLYSDLSLRPSTNPAMGGPFADGVGVPDIRAKFPLIRYLLEVAPEADPNFSSLQNSFECSEAHPSGSDPECTAATSASLTMPTLHCVRVRTVFGKRPETTIHTVANCRLGMCGDIGYEVVSERLCVLSDADGDGHRDIFDNCPAAYNPGQEDGDLDAIGDPCDICVSTYNPAGVAQVDTNGDAAIDPNDCVADPVTGQCDVDGDGAGDICDNCLLTANPGQEDGDLDAIGDACDDCASTYNPAGVAQVDTNRDAAIDPNDCVADPVSGQCDFDGDDFGDICDNCTLWYNPAGLAQVDTNGDAVIDPNDCVPDPMNGQCDFESDGAGDICDNCPLDVNPGQEDANGDGEGDVCEICHAGDPDGDGFCDDFMDDNCPGVYNPAQANNDRDLDGDLCDPDDDGDSVLDDGDGSGTVGDGACVGGATAGCDDNCQFLRNETQLDVDFDGIGDACDQDDGLVVLIMPSAASVEYQRDQGLSPFNVYRASIPVLAATGQYTQDPLAVPEAERFCGETSGTLIDAFEPLPGGAICYLGTGIDGLGQETALGTDSAGTPRPNDHPCP